MVVMVDARSQQAASMAKFHLLGHTFPISYAKTQACKDRVLRNRFVVVSNQELDHFMIEDEESVFYKDHA
nr:signal recognition particle subunit SRP68 [Tanacetum cinerariifolium]